MVQNVQSDQAVQNVWNGHRMDAICHTPQANTMEFSELMRLASGHAEARIIQVAVEIGVFETLADRQMPAPNVAETLGADTRAMTLLMNALAALQLLKKNGDRFALAGVARKYLLRSSNEYLGGMILFESWSWDWWANLAVAVRSGGPARAPDMYQGDPKETETFIGAMDSLVKARGDAEALANAIDWHRASELLDVGSGPATYPIALCRRFPHLHATVFDLPGTLQLTDRYVRQAGMAERIRLIAGDYRKDSIPGAYDIVFLSNVIHGEGHDENESLVGKLVSNLKSGGEMIIKDHILDDSGTSPPVGAIFSLLMLLTTAAGRCYSFSEIKRWMDKAGLLNARRVDLPPPLTSSLVIATKRG
jgi:hypothetical protein